MASVWYYGIDKTIATQMVGSWKKSVEISQHASLREAVAHKPKSDEIQHTTYSIVKRRHTA